MKLRVSRKKRKIAKVPLFAGVVIMFCAVPVAAFNHDLSLIGVVIGLIIGLIGVYQMSSLYRCPRCGKSVLNRERRWAIVPYRHCPDCGLQIDMEWTD